MKAEDWRALVEYRDGFLYWRVRPSSRGNVKAGDRAGTRGMRQGYWVVMYRGQRHGYHRVIWAVCNGDIPEGSYIDHIDRDPTNNRIENLRLATPAQNAFNTLKTLASKSSTFKGVCFSRLHGRPVYKASIRANGKLHHLGWFDHEEEAAGAYAEAALALHGEFAAF
jgi:hypothetical protein